MRFCLISIIALILFSNTSFSQLYEKNCKNYQYYAEVKQDTARVEIFLNKSIEHSYNQQLMCDEVLLRNKRKSDTLFIGKENLIVFKFDFLYLISKNVITSEKTISKVRLKRTEKDYRPYLRKSTYSADKIQFIRKLLDSLACPKNKDRPKIYTSLYSLNSESNLSTYKLKFDSIYQAELALIHSTRDTMVDFYYKTADSIAQTDSATILSLLSKADYGYNYAHYFLYKLSQVKPEILIKYVDSNPSNKKALLKDIRYNKYCNSIHKSVKNTKTNTKGKKEILKQKRRRITESTLLGAAYVTIIAAEVSLVVLLVVWIF